MSDENTQTSSTPPVTVTSVGCCGGNCPAMTEIAALHTQIDEMKSLIAAMSVPPAPPEPTPDALEGFIAHLEEQVKTRFGGRI